MILCEGSLALSGIRRMVVREDSGVIAGIAGRLRQAARLYCGVEWPVETVGAEPITDTIFLGIEPATVVHEQGYRLSLDSGQIRLTAHDHAGLFYGVTTLIQLLRQGGDSLPLGVIEDYPDFPVRGVMLDISRDKVPTMATLFALIDRFAEWKINHLELYTEHTFAYSRHPEVWAEASPMTGAEIRELDAYCRERFIELVPNQNSFGHMARWLKHPAYRDLAECPDGYDTPWGSHSTLPNSLNPADPRSLELIAGLYEELLPNFSSRKFNVGCDETWDLGQGKCRALCEQQGKGRVYLDFLLKIHEQVRKHGRTMHFWGDIIIRHPELVAEIPRDVVVLEWGYEADHPFAEHGALFAASGLPFYVCPGTSSWNSIAGRTENALANLKAAAESGLKYGAAGYLITDWGDNGHWQPLPVSYLGFAAGAALAWNADGNKDQDWRKVLDVHVFQDAAGIMGGVAMDLGNAYLKCGHQIANASVLFRLLNEKPDWPVPETVTRETLGQTRDFVAAIMERIPRARMSCPDAALVADEFMNAGRMLMAACHRLPAEMNPIIAEHRRLWLARNRPGGLGDSLVNLERRLRT
jgi:hexosaminidase